MIEYVPVFLDKRIVQGNAHILLFCHGRSFKLHEVLIEKIEIHKQQAQMDSHIHAYWP